MRAALAAAALAAGLAPAAAFAADDGALRPGVNVVALPAADARLARRLLVYLPAGYEARKSPMIVLFHGAGQRGDDPEKLKGNLALKYAQAHDDFPFILALPQAPAEAAGFEPAAVEALVDSLVAKLPVDPSRISLSGSSMGGIATWQVALASPRRYAALAPVSSKLDPEAACTLKDTPVWAFHNEQDKLIPIAAVRESVEKLRACGGAARLTAYAKGGHDAWTETYANPALYEWLAAQRR